MKQAAAKNRFGKIKTCIGTALCVVFGFLLICNLTILIKGTLNPEKPPSVLGVTPMVVLSGSMSGDQEDRIEIGDLIFISEADPEKLEVGDIIAFMSGKTTVTHRITAVTVAENGERLFTTKGDANNAEDTDPVTEDQLIGIYRVRIPKVGDFALFLQQPLGMLLFIGIPLLAFIVYDILRRQRYARLEQCKAQEMEAELARLRTLTGEQKPAELDPDDESKTNVVYPCKEDGHTSDHAEV